MVPEERLELSHLAATASKTVVSTIPPSGHILRFDTFRSCTPLECRLASKSRSRGYGYDGRLRAQSSHIYHPGVCLKVAEVYFKLGERQILLKKILLVFANRILRF